MASSSKPFGIKIQGSWSRAALENGEPGGISSSSDEDDGINVYPEILVRVEVNDTDETITPPEFVEVPNAEGSTPPPKKKHKKSAPVPKMRKSFYFCEICGEDFSQKFNKQRHMAIHVGDIKCPVCGATFNKQAALDKHMDSKHHEDMAPDSDESDDNTRKKYPKKNKANNKNNKVENAKNNKKKVKTSKRKNSERLSANTDKKSTESDKEEDKEVINSKTECDSNLQNAIVSKMQKGVMIKEICRLYHVTEEVVKEIWSEREKFVLPKKIPRRSYKYMNSVLEPLVLKWYKEEKSKNDKITGKLMQDVAEKIARQNGLVHFTANSKWIEQFKKKYNIYFKTRNRDYSSVSTESLSKAKFFEEQWSKIRPKYSDDQIYVGDEVGLFFNPSKSRERKFGGKKFVYGDPADRFAIFVCANVSGSDKRKLLVSSAGDPLRNSNRNANTLPVIYHRHAEGLITTYMYEDYIKKWNEELAESDEKAVVIVDRTSIHSKLQLSHLEFQYLPWKGANSIMPVRNGIYTRLRSEFRNLFLQFKAMNVFRGIDRHMTCLEGLEMLEKAWGRTPSEVITKSFIDVGYEVQTLCEDHFDSEHDESDQRLCEHLKDYDVEPFYTDVNSLDMYLTVDEAFLVAKGTNATLFGGNHKNAEPVVVKNDTLPINTNKPECEDKEDVLKKSNAIADLEIVRKYLLSNNTSLDTYRYFLDVEKEVMDHFVKLN